MYYHNRAITKYSDFIQQNPDYVKKVIYVGSQSIRSAIRSSSRSCSSASGNDCDLGMDPNLENLDPNTFVIDTIKFTELYPDRGAGSSGFNSGNSSTTDSALRKNLLEYEDGIDENENLNSRLLTQQEEEVQIQSDPDQECQFESGVESLSLEPKVIDPIPPPKNILSSSEDEAESPGEGDDVLYSNIRANTKNNTRARPQPQPQPRPALSKTRRFTKDSDKYFKNELGDFENSLGHIAKSPLPGYILFSQRVSLPPAAPAPIPVQIFKKVPDLAVKNLTAAPPTPPPPVPVQAAKLNNLNVSQKPSRSPPPSKQVVHYQSILPTWSPPEVPRRRHVHVPGILRRYNMDQWVAKIIWLYVNGDERHPRVEYRFRPEKDVRSFDGLCDILSKRLGLTRGVRFIYSLSGRPILNLDELSHEHSYVVSSTKKFKALNYGGSDPRISSYPAPAAARMTLPPVIRGPLALGAGGHLKNLNGMLLKKSRKGSTGSRRSRSRSPAAQAQAQTQIKFLGNNTSAVEEIPASIMKKNYPATEAEKIVNAVIGEANPVQRKVVRIINGQNPSMQSQVLLNTRVSQEWEDLVRDLSLAVKFPKNVKCHLETLVGRKILSYSQLRTELNAENQTFYIYANDERSGSRNSNSNLNHHQTLETLRNMENLSLEAARKGRSHGRQGNGDSNGPYYTPDVIRKSKSLIPLPNSSGSGPKNHLSRSEPKINR